MKEEQEPNQVVLETNLWFYFSTFLHKLIKIIT